PWPDWSSQCSIGLSTIDNSRPLRRPGSDPGLWPRLARLSLGFRSILQGQLAMHVNDQGRQEMATTTAARPPRSIPEQIAEEVGSAIIGGRHVVGERLIEMELAARFGVSRGPFREALRLLARRPPIALAPRRGAWGWECARISTAVLSITRLALPTAAARTMALVRPPHFMDTLRSRVDELRRLARDAGT